MCVNNEADSRGEAKSETINTVGREGQKQWDREREMESSCGTTQFSRAYYTHKWMPKIPYILIWNIAFNQANFYHELNTTTASIHNEHIWSHLEVSSFVEAVSYASPFGRFLASLLILGRFSWKRLKPSVHSSRTPAPLPFFPFSSPVMMGQAWTWLPFVPLRAEPLAEFWYGKDHPHCPDKIEFSSLPSCCRFKQTNKKSHLTVKTEKWLPCFSECSLKPRTSFLRRGQRVGKGKPLEQQLLPDMDGNATETGFWFWFCLKPQRGAWTHDPEV